MVRGKIEMMCKDCGHTFETLDIEYNMTSASMPMPCPKCNSTNTEPVSIYNWLKKLFGKIGK